jgi:hypothetical protein
MEQDDRLNVRIPKSLKRLLVKDANGSALAKVVRSILASHYANRRTT